MAGSFGMETPQGEHRYRLSFTVGGLLATQGRTLAEMYLKHVSDNAANPIRTGKTGKSEKRSP